MSGSNHAGPASILVVDDEADIRMLISDTLKREGYSVSECSEGRAALGLLTRGGVDLVVLDLGLPSLPGLDVLSEVRRRARCPSSS